MPVTKQEIEAIRVAIETARAPVTAKQVSKEALRSEKRVHVSRCEIILKRLVADEIAFEHPPSRSRCPVRYWYKDVVSRLAEQVETIVSLHPDSPPTLVQVKNSFSKCDLPWFDEAVGILINQRRLFEIRCRRTRRLSAKIPTAELMLSASDLQHLDRVIRKTASCRRTTLTVDDLLRFLGTSPDSSRKGAPPPLSESLLKAWYDQELPGLLGATSVPIPRTWERYKKWSIEQGMDPDLHAFHTVLERLAQEKTVELVPHSRSQPIPRNEQDLLMMGSHGETIYFWRWRTGSEK